MFPATAEGFGVELPEADLGYRWHFGDAAVSYWDKWEDVTEDEYNRHPQDSIWNDGRTVKDVRGPTIYSADGITRLGTDNIKGAQGWEPASGTATYLGQAKNFGYNWLTAHVYTGPGTYTVTCLVKKRNEAPVSKTLQVTVLDPDAVFSFAQYDCRFYK